METNNAISYFLKVLKYHTISGENCVIFKHHRWLQILNTQLWSPHLSFSISFWADIQFGITQNIWKFQEMINDEFKRAPLKWERQKFYFSISIQLTIKESPTCSRDTYRKTAFQWKYRIFASLRSKNKIDIYLFVYASPPPRTNCSYKHFDTLSFAERKGTTLAGGPSIPVLLPSHCRLCFLFI